MAHLNTTVILVVILAMVVLPFPVPSICATSKRRYHAPGDDPSERMAGSEQVRLLLQPGAGTPYCLHDFEPGLVEGAIQSFLADKP
ncbi:hypothetical protein [Bifidobacterium xylocopae]|uniref:Uncharacterized protein n=1 Tax=Bifidobacterium xylocopae TaxID=2493119 RepID=A0A366KFR1_9BIFI|nr:hypothetical protein [Bifidobacterium xylocopae]RBQ00093.1 hypothetical protein CRD59_01140 [Bifidobacterium xylocopae]